MGCPKANDCTNLLASAIATRILGLRATMCDSQRTQDSPEIPFLPAVYRLAAFNCLRKGGGQCCKAQAPNTASSLASAMDGDRVKTTVPRR